MDCDWNTIPSAICVQEINKHDDIDHGYYIAMVDKAIEAIEKYEDFEAFVS